MKNPPVVAMDEQHSRSATERVPVSEAVKGSPALVKRLQIRTMSEDEWIEQHGSGTLRKNKRIGFRYFEQYLEERTAYEFGWGFQIVPATRFRWGDAFTEGDSKPLTEAGWHIERFFNIWPFPEDEFEVKNLDVTYKDETRREGPGIIVRKTSAQWIGSGKAVFAIVAEWDPARNMYLPAKNPF